MLVQGHVSHKRLLQIQCAVKSGGFKHIGNKTIEALEHSIGFDVRALVKRCSISKAWQSWPNSLAPLGIRSLLGNKRPVNSLLLSVSNF